jgi:hypothetical protein
LITQAGRRLRPSVAPLEAHREPKEEKRDFVAAIDLWYNKLCCRNAAKS